jgi:hypothetical protein
LEALLQEFNQVGDAAPTSQVLNHLDPFLFVNGRKFLTEFLGTSSYRRAAEMLQEFGCITISHQTVGDVAVEVAGNRNEVERQSCRPRGLSKGKGRYGIHDGWSVCEYAQSR